MQDPIPQTTLRLCWTLPAHILEYCCGRRLIVLRFVSRGATDDDFRRGEDDRNTLPRGPLYAQGALNSADIVIAHPVAHEEFRRTELDFGIVYAEKLQGTDPRIEHGVSQFPPQALPCPAPHSFPSLGRSAHDLCHCPLPSCFCCQRSALEPRFFKVQASHLFVLNCWLLPSVSSLRHVCLHGSPEAFQPFWLPR